MVTLDRLHELLVGSGLVDWAAIDDAENYDGGNKLAEIEWLHGELTAGSVVNESLTDAATQALDALDCIYSPLHVREINKVGAAMSALRKALAEQTAQQEPFEYWNAVEGWVKIDEVRGHFESVGCGTIYKSPGEGRVPLYTAPQPTIPPGYKLVPVDALTKWRDAFAEELSAWDIDPPLHHVKTSHDEITVMLAAAPEAPKLAKPAEQEPVAWKHDCAALLTNDVELWIDACPHCGKPRTAPQPRRRLTDEEIDALFDWGNGQSFRGFARAIEDAIFGDKT